MTTEEELKQIDDLLYDASAEFCMSEVVHQVTHHSDTLHLYAGRLAEHLRKINTVGEARRQRIADALEEPEAEWGDRDDEWSEQIAAAHPTRTDGRTHKHWATAMKMVGNRHSKDALVSLVCWLLWSRIPDPSI